jgi:hypothetical protein
MNFTSLEDAFPSKPWPTKSQIHKKHVVEQRDSEKEGRTFPTPQHRGQHAIQKHKKTIDDLTSSLPISKEEEEGNYNPTRIEGGREHYTYEKVHPMDGTSFPYAPPQFQLSSHELKLQKLVEMFDSMSIGEETPGTQDMLLYIFTGVFFLYTFEIFANMNK